MQGKDSDPPGHPSTVFKVLLNFLVTVKAAPHECVIRTGSTLGISKAGNEEWFYLKVTVSLYHNILVKTVMI